MATDAVGIKPKLIPNFELLPRDDSGGPEWDPHAAAFGDGGYVTGGDEKGHISASGGGQHAREGTEESDKNRTVGYDRIPGDKHRGDRSTSRASKESLE